jgi:hypothetical protein
MLAEDQQDRIREGIRNADLPSDVMSGIETSNDRLAREMRLLRESMQGGSDPKPLQWQKILARVHQEPDPRFDKRTVAQFKRDLASAEATRSIESGLTVNGRPTTIDRWTWEHGGRKERVQARQAEARARMSR